MSQLIIKGGRRLHGEVAVQGAKNSVLPILAATLLTSDTVALEGCPRLRDVDASMRILEGLGCSARWEGNTLTADTSVLHQWEISDILMREMRSSAVFLGAILARCGQAELSYPGGCELGPRPIDLHLAGLRELGAEIEECGGLLHCKASRLRGKEIVLSLPSVGATENLMLAACGAEGVTTIAGDRGFAGVPECLRCKGFRRWKLYGGRGGRTEIAWVYLSGDAGSDCNGDIFVCGGVRGRGGLPAGRPGGPSGHGDRRSAGGRVYLGERPCGHPVRVQGASYGSAPRAYGSLSWFSYGRTGDFNGGAAAESGNQRV